MSQAPVEINGPEDLMDNIIERQFERVFKALADRPEIALYIDPDTGMNGLHQIVTQQFDTTQRPLALDLIRLFRIQENLVGANYDDWVPLVNALLEVPADCIDPEIQGSAGKSPAHLAAVFGDYEMLDALLEPNPQLRVSSVDLPIERADSDQDLTVADLRLKDKRHGLNCMHILAHAGNAPLFSRYLTTYLNQARGDNAEGSLAINATDDPGNTFLILAAASGSSALCQAIYDQIDVDYSAVDCLGQNFFHIASANQDSILHDQSREIIEFLYDNSYKVSSGDEGSIDDDGPGIAQVTGRNKFFELLVSRDNQGKTPIYNAYHVGKNADLVHFLEEKTEQRLEKLIKSVKSQASQESTQLEMWLAKLQKDFVKVGLSNKKQALKNESVARHVHYAEMLILDLQWHAQKPEPSSEGMMESINSWQKNTKDDLYDDVLRNKWKMLLATLLIAFFITALGFGVTYSLIKLPAWQIASQGSGTLLSAAKADIWVAPGHESLILGLVTTAIAFVATVGTALCLNHGFFSDRRSVTKVAQEQLEVVDKFIENDQGNSL